MPIEPLPFAAQQASGLEELAGAPRLSVNALTDLSGATRARPGIAAWSGFPTTIPNVGGSVGAVMAMTVYNNQVVYATEDRNLFVCDGAGGVTALSSIAADTKIDGFLRPQLLSLRTKVVAVGGGAPQSTDAASLSFRLAGSPPNLTTIAGIATRIVGSLNDSSGKFQWSNLGDSGHSTWDSLNYSEAEAKPDVLQAVATNTNELFAFGAETLQVYAPDPIQGFATGRALNIGLLAPYSLITVDDQFAFIERERRFVLTDGRSFTEDSILSKPIEATIRDMTTIEDAWGFRMRVDRWDVPTWMLPTEGKGLMWNRRSNTWSEWRAFDSSGYAAPEVTAALHWPEANLFLVGLSTGQIAKLDADTYTDLGSIIKVEMVSGFIDHATDNIKKHISTKFVFRRGMTAQSGSAPLVQISYRDSLGAYSTPTLFSLGLAGDYDPVVEMRSEGVYRRRQWKLEFTSQAELSFVGAREEYQVLDN